MKIGILTLPFNNNYGGLLQSYALQTILKNRGHQVILINIPTVKNYPLKGRIKKILKDLTGQTLKERKRLYEISTNMRDFVTENMVLTDPLLNNSDFHSLKEEKFDVFIVGSDQVWRFDYTKHQFARYFFDFLYNSKLKRLSFAASFGIDVWNKSAKDTELLIKLISEFAGVSVRESSAVNLCKKHLQINAKHILDPTLYLDRSYYQTLLQGKAVDGFQSKDSVLYYVLDANEDKGVCIDKVAKILDNTKLYKAGVKQKSQGKYNADMVYPSVYQWLFDFINCQFVVTDSFHGCVFSIIFNKPFLVYANKNRGITRFESILKTVGLDDRIVFDSKEVDERKVKGPIDYQKINLILKKAKIEMREFLEQYGL